MMETVIMLKPQVPVAQGGHLVRPLAAGGPKRICAHITPDHISTEQLVNEMDDALRIPGVSNAWTMPIKNRIDMLTTGVRTPVGIKIYGAGPGADRAHRHRRSSASCRRCAARAASSPSAWAAATSWIST